MGGAGILALAPPDLGGCSFLKLRAPGSTTPRGLGLGCAVTQTAAAAPQDSCAGLGQEAYNHCGF